MALVIQNLSINGLGTVTWVCPATTPLLIDGKMSLPTLEQDGISPPTAALMTINQNGSPIYTGMAGAEGFRINNVSATLNDTFTFVLTSTLTAPSVDSALNSIRGVIAISSGG